ncbi:MAG: hypothetical protein WC606_01405 [Candidatus Absconditabacterales bacterium]
MIDKKKLVISKDIHKITTALQSTLNAIDANKKKEIIETMLFDDKTMFTNEASPVMEKIEKKVDIEKVWLEEFKHLDTAYNEGNTSYIEQNVNKEVDGLVDMLETRTKRSDFLPYIVNIRKKSRLSDNYKKHIISILKSFKERLQSDSVLADNYIRAISRDGVLIDHILGKGYQILYGEILDKKLNEIREGEHPRMVISQDVAGLELQYIIDVMERSTKII